MDIGSLLLLCASILLSSGRNILSKGISKYDFGKRGFFLSQSVIFGFGSLILLLFAWKSIWGISALTLIYAAIYAILLVFAQWFFTIALRNGKTGICSTVYSLGFILPTLSGVFFFDETVGAVNIIGILVVIPTIIISGTKSAKMVESKENVTFIVPLLAAAISSGGLGIMQKVQQKSPFPEEKSAFVFFAFLFATAISLVAFAIAKSDNTFNNTKKAVIPSLVGACFALCNVINTTLAGRLDSAVFFPMLNIGSILMSLALGILIYHEKLTKKDAVILLLGATSILLINL